jgi:alpha-mannosidase
VTILKPASDGNAAIVRLRSLSNKTENVKLSFPAGTSKSVRHCPNEETSGEPVTGNITLPLYGLGTFRVEFTSGK